MPPLGPKALANRAKFRRNRKDPRHGTANGYGNLGCKCKRCTTAWNAQHKRYMHEDPARLKKHADREMVRRTGKVKRKIAYKPKITE